ncbi:unnamed protein product [Diamesa tonsa]
MRLIKTILECLAFFYASFQTINVLSSFVFLFLPKYALMGLDYYYSDYNAFLMMELFVFSIVLMIGIIKSKRFCLLLWMSWAVIEALFICYGFYSQTRTDLPMAGMVLGSRLTAFVAVTTLDQIIAKDKRTVYDLERV